MQKRKKILWSAIILLALAAVVGAGTFATFTAQTRNPDNRLSTGTLVLVNTEEGATDCLSTAGGSTDTNVNNACDTLFNLSVRKPGDSGVSNLTLKNDGSLNASVFKVFSNACTNDDAPGETYHGTGNPCAAVQLYVQEFSDSGFTTASACRYGGSSDGGITCDFSNTAKTLGDFQSSYNSTANGLSLSALGAGSSRYFGVGVKLPSTADNSFQGRRATIDFSWYAAQ